jgi:hypothetical protein
VPPFSAMKLEALCFPKRWCVPRSLNDVSIQKANIELLYLAYTVRRKVQIFMRYLINGVNKHYILLSIIKFTVLIEYY